MANILDNIVQDKYDVKTQISSVPDAIPSIKRFINPVAIRRLFTKQFILDPADSFILGSATNAILGTSKLGDRRIELNNFVFPHNNIIEEDFLNDIFLEDGNYTLSDESATIISSRDIMTSKTVAKIGQSINSVKLTDFDYEAEISNLQGWWKLDGNAYDSSGNENDGTWNGTEQYAAGKISETQAADFDGSSHITFDNVLDLGTSDFTITGWFNNSNISTLQCLVNKKNDVGAASQAGYALFIESNRLRTAISDGVNQIRADTTNYIPTTWFHGIFTFKYPDTINIYINNTDDTDVISPGILTSSIDNSIDLRFGSDNGIRRYNNGLIQDIRVYDKVLSEEERNSIYNEGLGIINNSAPPIIEVNTGDSWVEINKDKKEIFTTGNIDDELKYRITANTDGTVINSPLKIQVNKG